MAINPKVILGGLAFPESPRWHNDKLWFSDVHAHRIMTVDMEGNSEVIVDEVPGHPSGLGWLPDGRLLVVSLYKKQLLRLDKTGLTEVADLSTLASGICNDMVVDSHGQAYIGNAGLDTNLEKNTVGPAEIIKVTPNRDTQVVAEDMIFPNGTVITPDERTLIVAESFKSCLTAFDINPDGSLKGRRVWAQLENGVTPDGICLDAEGAIWLADAGNEVVRVKEGGEVTDKIKAKAYACMLGGHNRRILFILTAETFIHDEARAQSSGRIKIVEVKVPGVGFP